LDYEQSHPLTTRGRDQSGSGYSDPEQLEHGFSPYFLQRHEDIAIGSIEEESNKQQGHRKRPYLPETDIFGDSESDDDTHLKKRSRIRSEDLARLRRIPNPISTTPSPIIDSSTSKFGGHSPAPSNNNHSDSTRSPVSLTCPELATTTEFREWPFQGFLKRTIIGNDAIYTLEFQLQHVPEHLHLPVIAEALNTDTAATPRNMIHSRVHPARSRAKSRRVRWEPEEHDTIVRMKGEGCSWEEIHHALPHRTSAAIQVQYSTKLKR
jgi:hypothetical protein